MIKIGVYQHYKGNYYEVLGVAKHSETLEDIVVYKQLYGDYSLWVRPLKMFLENINVRSDDANFSQVPRFKFIRE